MSVRVCVRVGMYGESEGKEVGNESEKNWLYSTPAALI